MSSAKREHRPAGTDGNRMITDFLQNVLVTNGCLGCAIGNGRAVPPGGLIKKTGNFVLHQDPETPIEGFLILAAKSHIKSITELSPSERHELIDLMSQAASAVKELEISEEITILQEERSSHLHFWLLPRFPWMDPLLQTPSGYRGILAYAKANFTDPVNTQKLLDTVERLKRNLGTINDTKE